MQNITKPTCTGCTKNMQPFYSHESQEHNKFYCDRHATKNELQCDVRWRCAACDYDICFSCHSGTSIKTSKSHLLSDESRASQHLHGNVALTLHDATQAIATVTKFALLVHSYYDGVYGIEASRGEILHQMNPYGERASLQATAKILMERLPTAGPMFFVPYHRGVAQYYKLPLSGAIETLTKHVAETWMKDTINSVSNHLASNAHVSKRLREVSDTHFPKKRESIGAIHFVHLYLDVQDLLVEFQRTFGSQQKYAAMVHQCWPSSSEQKVSQKPTPFQAATHPAPPFTWNTPASTVTPRPFQATLNCFDQPLTTKTTFPMQMPTKAVDFSTPVAPWAAPASTTPSPSLWTTQTPFAASTQPAWPSAITSTTIPAAWPKTSFMPPASQQKPNPFASPAVSMKWNPSPAAAPAAAWNPPPATSMAAPWGAAATFPAAASPWGAAAAATPPGVMYSAMSEQKQSDPFRPVRTQHQQQHHRQHQHQHQQQQRQQQQKQQQQRQQQQRQQQQGATQQRRQVQPRRIIQQQQYPQGQQGQIQQHNHSQSHHNPIRCGTCHSQANNKKESEKYFTKKQRSKARQGKNAMCKQCTEKSNATWTQVPARGGGGQRGRATAW